MDQKYPDFIYEYVRQNLGLEEDDTSQDERINNMSRKQVLERVLTWQGIIGYSQSVIDFINAIYNIELEEGD